MRSLAGDVAGVQAGLLNLRNSTEVNQAEAERQIDVLSRQMESMRVESAPGSSLLTAWSSKLLPRFTNTTWSWRKKSWRRRRRKFTVFLQMENLFRMIYRVVTAKKNLPPNLNLKDTWRTYTKIPSFRKIHREGDQSDCRENAR